MAHIAVPDGLPGITGLLEYRLDTARPIRELTQLMLRGPSSLSEGERELIAAVVSHGNGCRYCTAAHTEAANLLLEDEEASAAVLADTASANVSDKMKALLAVALKVRENGRLVTEEDIETARGRGATDGEIHDTVLIAALFSLYNRYVDGLGAWTPDDPAYYRSLAARIVHRGYLRAEGGYERHKYAPPER